MESKYIAAIEIGSSKIKTIVATVDQTDTIEVVAIESADAGDGVRYGRIQNAREVSTTLEDIIRRIENNPRLAKGTINTVYVADGGRSVSSTRAEATVSQGSDAEVTLQTIERLQREARADLATDRTILEVSARRYLVDNGEVKKAIGAFGNEIKGEFTIVTASPENRKNLDRVKIESRGKDVARQYFSRTIALGETLLADSDRQLGCMLVDFGAETTTLAIYRDNALQMITTLPMGSSNINHDLCSGLSVTAESAENIKRTKGEAIAERIQYAAPDAETLEIVNLVSARVGEIIANINNQVSLAGFKPQDLAAGIVVTGGGARLKGFIEMLETQSKMKVRRASLDSSIKVAQTIAADNIDVIALIRYIASHFETNCIDFPVEQQGVEKPVSETVQTVASTAQPRPTATPSERRRYISEDDDALLDDDPEDEQPVNICDDPEKLPEPDKDPNKTRRSLMDRIRSFLSSQGSDDSELDDMD